MKTIRGLRIFLLLIVVIGNNTIYAGPPGQQKGITWEEVREAEQIPDSILQNMSTEDLLLAYLDSRYPGYLLAYNTVQDAFMHAYNDFNGLRELLSRNDAGEKLIAYYQGIDPSGIDPNWGPIKKGAFTFSIVFIEVLLAHDNILARLTKSETNTLLTELLKKQEYKISHPEVYSIIGVQFNAYAIARLIESKGMENGYSQSLLQIPEMRYLLTTGRLQKDETLSTLVRIAYEFMQNY